jgi:hypothetical protein
MTEQLKAEAFVREAIPELMELTFGCRVKYGTSYTTVWQVLLAENSKEPNHYNTVDVRGASNYLRDIQSSEIIGHPIALHHWLGVLDFDNDGIGMDGKLLFVDAKIQSNNLIKFNKTVKFNLTTGQPATQADFKAFNDIVSV